MTEWESEDFATLIPSLFLFEDLLSGNDYKFRWFDCLGEVGAKEICLNANSYLLSNEHGVFSNDNYNSQWKKPGKITLFGRNWDKGSVLLSNLDTVFRMASQELMELDRAAKISGVIRSCLKKHTVKKDYIASRRCCVELLLFVRHYLLCLQKDTDYNWLLEQFIPNIKKRLVALRQHLGYLINLPSYIYHHCSNSSGNKCSQPAYHLMHVHLDLRWLHLTLIFCVAKGECYLNGSREINPLESNFPPEDEVIKHIRLLVSELTHLAVERFKKINANDVLRKSPFNCTCVQELWLLVQLFTDDWSKEGICQQFWHYANEQLDAIRQSTDSSVFDNCNYDYRNMYCPFEMASPNTEMCSLWMLYHLAKLHNYKELRFGNNQIQDNYKKLESILKLFVTHETSEADMRKCLVFVETLCLEVWAPKTEPILVLWEYFYKKFESTFYIPGTTPDNLAVVEKSSLALVSQVKSFFSDRKNVRNSFQHFLRIIGLLLRLTNDNPKNWNKIKGRVYSKFFPAKMVSLKRVGEHNFVTLFVTLAAVVNISQVESKMVELVNYSIKMKDSLSAELIKGQFALAILLVEQNLDISRVIQPLVLYLNSLPFAFHKDIYRLFVESIQDIIDCNECLNLGQHVFVDIWIAKYLSGSSFTDISRLVDVLLSIISKLHRKVSLSRSYEQVVILTIEKLWDQLRSYLNTATTKIALLSEISDLTAHLAILFYEMSNIGRYKEIFDMFTKSELADIRLLRRFIFKLIQHESVLTTSRNYDKAVIKAWVRCGLLCSDNNAEMKAITTFVCDLPEIKTVCKQLLDNMKLNDEPLLLFLTSLHCNYLSIKDIHEKQSLREKFYCYTDGIELWLKPVLNFRLSDQLERVFFIVGNMFRLISPILYVKSKPNTLLQKLLDILLLPVSVHKPDVKLPQSVLLAVRRTLHFYIEGLLKLNPENDNYISRVLRELIMIYLPMCLEQYSTFSSGVRQTFILIIEFHTFDTVMKSFIIKSVCNNFLKKNCRKPQMHSLVALRFIKEIMQCHSQKANVILLIISCAMDRIFEVLMFFGAGTAEVKLANEVLNMVLNNDVSSSNEGRESLMQAFSSLCKDHLAWSSRQLFDLMENISSRSPRLVTRFMPLFIDHIKQVELRRGVGYDKNLRLGFERVQIKLRLSEQ